VEGHIKGPVDNSEEVFTIGRYERVYGVVVAKGVSIFEELTGDITAETVQLENAAVNGNISTRDMDIVVHSRASHRPASHTEEETISGENNGDRLKDSADLGRLAGLNGRRASAARRSATI
jgi:hypothetical protein